MDELLKVSNSASDLAAWKEKENASIHLSGKEYLATAIWHEAFHAYQMSRYSEGMDVLSSFAQQEDWNHFCDDNAKAKELFLEKTEILNQIRLTQDIDTQKKLILQYRELPDDEIVENMFRPFVRGDKARKTNGGTGLGLAIAEAIVKKHGGTLTYEVEDGMNSFVIMLQGEE